MAAVRNAIVTGGAGDLGLAIARRLHRDGWQIGLLDLRPEDVRRAAAQIPGAVALVADVTDEAACQLAVAAFGRPVGLLVNNAGIGRFGPLHELSTADFRKVIEVNLVAPYIMAKAVVGGMIAQQHGHIVNITSLNAVTPGPGSGGYPAAKAGLAKLTEQMALEWGKFGIRANSVAPGFIDAGISTPFYKDPAVRALRTKAVPTGRLGAADDIAEAVNFLASDAASYINAHQLVVDGGVAPSVLLQLPREPGK
jgi:NAD(P)-dependent dehydrogenase (short-subunit alcohol dehydrogenase family)